MHSRARLVLAVLFVLAGCGDAADADADADGGTTLPDTNCETCTLDDQLPEIGDDCGQKSSEGLGEDVVTCVRKHLASGEPFRVREQRMGIDSAILYAWTLDAAGVVKQYDFDSDICGAGGGCANQSSGCGPRVSVWTCQGASLVVEMDDLDMDADSGIDFGRRAPLIECASRSEEEALCEPTDENR